MRSIQVMRETTGAGNRGLRMVPFGTRQRNTSVTPSLMMMPGIWALKNAPSHLE